MHIRRRRLALNIALYAVLYALLAIALPWYLFVPVAILIVSVHAFFESREVSKRYQRIIDSIRSVHGDSIGDISRIRARDVDETIYKAFKEVAAELERKNFQLVEKNIQLLSIKEIGLTLVSSLDESRVVDAVINFLSKGLGYRELFVGIFQPEGEEINLYTFRDTPSGHRYEETTTRILDIDGVMRKALLMQQSLLVRDPEEHALGAIAGNPLFADSTMNSFVVVPLVQSGATRDCADTENCLLNMSQVSREATSVDTHYRCPACQRIPVLGLVGVTDGFKAASLSKVDLVSVETLAVQLSAMLENNRLFAELKHEEAYRDNVINSMMNGLLTVDPTGHVLFANATACELTGYDQAALRGMHIDRLISDSQKRGGENPILRTLRKGRKSFQQEALMRKHDGRSAPVILNTSFLVDEARDIQGVLVVFDDITRIKRMEEQIVHLDKLAALGRFSSSIAHEIRNPLTGIAAGIQYLKRAGQVADTQHENINFILEEVSRIDRLIGDLMNVVRVSDLIYEEVQLEDIIDGSVTGMQELANRKSVAIETVFPGATRKVSVDSDRMTQVLINLIKNAIEASRTNGKVSIALTFPSDVSDVLFDAVQDFAIIEVRDRGVGLTEEEKTRVFEPFFSTKTGGTGLGLYVTHSIIERHGGYIYVDSEHGAGTTFTVYIPVEQVQHGDSTEVSYPAGR